MQRKSDAIVRIISNNIDIDYFSPYKIDSDDESVGTGFFINKDGYILTCAHVVNNSIKIYISTPLDGKKKYEVKIHSICFDKDMAILKPIDYINTHFCNLGNSDNIKTENEVIAVGYPLAQDRLKKTKGIISGMQDRYIQIDAPINPGNSGGPLFNSEMEVIAINTAKISSDNAENIGYATPINDFKLIQSLMYNPPPNKIIKEVNLYCELQDTSEEHYILFGCPNRHGCIVKNLIKKSPFYNAGIRENDILLSFDNINIDSNGDMDVKWSNEKSNLFDVVVKYNPEMKINIKYWSTLNKKIINVMVTLSDNNLYNIKQYHYPHEQADYEIFGGMIIMELNLNHLLNMKSSDFSLETKFKLLEYKKLTRRSKKILFISKILQGSYISTLNYIKSGSIIQNVNGTAVNSLNEFRNIIKQEKIIVNNNILIYLRLLDKNQIILNFDKILKEEIQLSERYKYKISDLYK